MEGLEVERTEEEDMRMEDGMEEEDRELRGEDEEMQLGSMRQTGAGRADGRGRSVGVPMKPLPPEAPMEPAEILSIAFCTKSVRKVNLMETNEDVGVCEKYSPERVTRTAKEMGMQPGVAVDSKQDGISHDREIDRRPRGT